MTRSELEAAFRAVAAARKYSDVTVDRWLRLSPDDGAVVLALAQELRLGDNQLRDLWEWAEEIAARDGTSLVQVLAAEPIDAARRRTVGRNDKLKLIKGALRRVRFPQLAAVEDQLGRLIDELGLPPSVRVTLPDFLEGDELRVEITARSAAALRDAAARLLAASESPACSALFELLGEVP